MAAPYWPDAAAVEYGEGTPLTEPPPPVPPELMELAAATAAARLA